jgi:hypothetical protein
MSLLVRYTLTDAASHDGQISAMEAFVADLNTAAIPGLNYSCFATDSPVEFVGVLEFADDAAKEAFMGSAAFATYKERVGPSFANPPQTTDITAIASTRA